MSGIEILHFTAAVIALLVGGTVLGAAKGTARHVLLGRGFVAAMLAVNSAALLSYEDGRFGVFHWLALLSLGTLAMGLRAIRNGNRADHAGWMSWTVAGLASAGLGQLAVALGAGQTGTFVSIGLVLSAAVLWINILGKPAAAADALHR